MLADPNLNRVFAKNPRRLRTKSRRPQEEFADQCGLHRTYIGAIERGERNGWPKALEASSSLAVRVCETPYPQHGPSLAKRRCELVFPDSDHSPRPS